MKKQILLFFLITFANFIFSQTDTLFFDKDWKKCIRSDAEFYRLITRSGTDYIVKDSYINNKPQMIAVCSVLEPLIKDGKCTFYDKNGLRTKTGTYNNNNPTGRWVWWDNGGKDSTVAEYKPDGTKNYTRMSEVVSKNKDVFTVVERMPAFVGGDDALYKFLQKKIKYPKKERKANITGKVYIEFIIDKDGSIMDVKEKRGIKDGAGLTKEAIRVVKKMPRWKPGMQNSRTVKVQMVLPINFSLK